MANGSKYFGKNGDDIQIPQILPILPLPGLILFPGFSEVIVIIQESSKKLLRFVLEGKINLVGVVARKPEQKEIFFEIGTVAEIISTKLFEYPLRERQYTVGLQGVARFRIKKILQDEPFYTAEIELLPDKISKANETEAWAEAVKSSFMKALDLLEEIGQPPAVKEELLAEIAEIKEPGEVAHFVVDPYFFWKITLEDRQEVLEINDVNERLIKVYGLLESQIARLKVRKKIEAKIQKAQRDLILREQRQAIDEELGGEPEDIKKYKEKAKKAHLPEEAKKEFDDQLERFSRMNPHDPTRQWIETWLDWITSVPWSKSTEDQSDVIKAEKILEEDHYGLEKVKKRIVEFLAVRKLKPKGKSPILCFIGPPGTGKTSVGKSIARAMGRKFIRISLGGVSDEAQIRGHRRTYVGAMPGIIIQELKRASSNNPVFMIDEIDKIGTSALHGDPSSALLEALDPEQNFAFMDHYLNVPFDFSKVMFITTGNLSEPIQPALRDRMEIIDFPGYTREEKLEIAKKYLVPRQLETNGLKKNQLRFQDKALQSIIRDYTKEAGVRNLEREIGNCCRRIAAKISKNEISKEVITENELSEILRPKKYVSTLKERISRPGVAIGLAWTPFGGEILFIETEMIRGIKEPELEITGNVEKIMQESAKAALTFVEANLKMLGISRKRSPVGNKIHIHVPEAAMPKDGPSAGIAIFVALVSLLKKEKVRNDIAMSGEITLRGKVLPVGGIKEKVLAAKEAGIKTIILPEENRKDEAELPKSVREALYREEIEIKYISEMKEALEIALKS